MLRTEKNVTASAYNHHAYLHRIHDCTCLRDFGPLLVNPDKICLLVALLKIFFFISGN